MLSILLADDHPVFREGLRALLESTGQMQILAEASDGAEALRLALEVKPDLILMDIDMPGMPGIEATRRIQAQMPEMRILMLTMFEDDASVFAAIQAGALGYLLKGTPKADVVQAIQGIMAGEVIFGAGVAERVMNYFAQARPVPIPAFPELTGRERQMLELIAQRHTNAQIARLLELSPKTVRNYVSIILSKLHVADRTEALWLAKSAGLPGSRPN